MRNTANPSGLIHGLPALILLIALAGGCTTIAPPVPPENPALGRTEFSHTFFDQVLGGFVDESGRVDYAALKRDRSNLDRYYALLAAVSPDSHPELFPDEQARLTYWINAYNATVLEAVLAYYPIESVAQVRRPAVFFFLPRLSGFFLFQRVTLGGDGMSLYSLENQLIRRRFKDPRIHFALNCASASCPTLPQRAFTAVGLDRELETEARKFVSQDRNVRIDAEARTIELSSIFAWYEEDFVNWQNQQERLQGATLLDYIASLVPPEKAAALRDCTGCSVRFVPYDWQLNDRARP